ncbi:MAG: AzlC family ABC transporter permease [Halanaerobiales bacterium]
MKEDFTAGVKSALPVAIGYIPIAITFGLLAKDGGLSLYITFLMSLMVFAGASQFVALKLLGMGTGVSEIIITTFILNFRHFLMSASLARKVRDQVPKKWLALLSFGITDETFSVSSMQEGELGPGYMLGLNFTSYLAWVGGSVLGFVVGANLPGILQESMGIALYAMFIGLLVPAVKESRTNFIIVAITLGISSLFYYLSRYISVSEGWRIILVTVISALIGTLLFQDDKQKEVIDDE